MYIYICFLYVAKILLHWTTVTKIWFNRINKKYEMRHYIIKMSAYSMSWFWLWQKIWLLSAFCCCFIIKYKESTVYWITIMIMNVYNKCIEDLPMLFCGVDIMTRYHTVCWTYGNVNNTCSINTCINCFVC